MSYRVEQVNSLIQKDIGSIISRELEMPSGSLLTITRVRTRPDLKTAKIFVSILPDSKTEEVLLYLSKNQKLLQKELAKNLTMKFSPKIEFFLDETEKEANKIEAILDSLKNEG